LNFFPLSIFPLLSTTPSALGLSQLFLRHLGRACTAAARPTTLHLTLTSLPKFPSISVFQFPIFMGVQKFCREMKAMRTRMSAGPGANDEPTGSTRLTGSINQMGSTYWPV
jgi:hypothetical protein